jgi:hypothetical protein
MKIFTKLKQFNAVCHFCGGTGLVVAGYVSDDEKEIAVCDSCARKLISGIETALAEIKRLAEEKEKSNLKTEEK